MKLVLKNIFLILSAYCWFGCQNPTKEVSTIISNNNTNIIKQDSIIVDSIIRNTNANSMVFLNYPNFINEKVYQKIRELNIKVGTLDEKGCYSGYFSDESIKFNLQANFEDDKLISMTLSNNRDIEKNTKISETMFNNRWIQVINATFCPLLLIVFKYT